MAIPIPTINRYKNGPFFRLALLLILPIGVAITCNQRLARRKNASVFNYGQLLGLVLADQLINLERNKPTCLDH